MVVFLLAIIALLLAIVIVPEVIAGVVAYVVAVCLVGLGAALIFGISAALELPGWAGAAMALAVFLLWAIRQGREEDRQKRVERRAGFESRGIPLPLDLCNTEEEKEAANRYYAKIDIKQWQV